MPAVASSAPAVLIGHLADATTTLRVGAGGVMLPNHAPMVVAEQFATLEALHPGRIDLGLGRAPGTDPATARALRRSADVGAERFPEDVVELISYLVDSDGPATFPAPVPGRGLPAPGVAARLVDVQRPAGRHARAAVQLRLPLRPGPGRRGRRPLPVQLPPYRAPGRALRDGGGVGAVRRHRRGGPLAGRPVARSPCCSCAAGTLGPVVTPEEAAAYPYTDQERALVEAATADHAVGDPDTVHRRLAALVERTGADELMLSTRAHSLETRARSLTLVAERWGSPARRLTDGRSEAGDPGQDLVAQQGQVVEVGQVEDLQVGPAVPMSANRPSLATTSSGVPHSPLPAARPPRGRWRPPGGRCRRRSRRSRPPGPPSSSRVAGSRSWARHASRTTVELAARVLGRGEAQVELGGVGGGQPRRPLRAPAADDDRRSGPLHRLGQGRAVDQRVVGALEVKRRRPASTTAR